MTDTKVGEAILLSRKAENEFVDGNLPQAKILFTQAADLLLEVSDASKNAYERNALKYSAAVLYFNGGDYQKCFAVFGGVNIVGLRDHQIDFMEIHGRAKERSNHYPAAVQQEIQKVVAKARDSDGSKQAWERLLSLLKEHPYAISYIETTKLRCEALAKLNRNEEAELFKSELEKSRKQLLLDIAARKVVS